MTPEEIFGGSGTHEWGTELCLYLIQEHPQIQQRDDYDTFSEEIAGWRSEQHRDIDDEARSLFEICDKHGLLTQLKGEQREARTKGATRGGVRTRGGKTVHGVKTGGGSNSSGLEELLTQVATQFSS